MKTHGYKIDCDDPFCSHSEFFELEEDYLDGDWYRVDGEDLCDECANGRENTRDEQAKIAEIEGIPYASAVRDCLNNGEG